VQRIASAAVILLAALVVGCTGNPGGLPTPTSTIEPSNAAVEPSATGTPSPALTPTPSPTETPTPSASPAGWLGLEWSSGVLARVNETAFASVADILPWSDGYVGVGSVNRTVGIGDDAFFTSADGLHWTVTDHFAQGSAEERTGPQFLVHLGTGLLAVSDNDGFSPPNLWRSGDGQTWMTLDSPSWREAWTNGNLLAVAGGPAGLVAVGSEGLSLMEPGRAIIVRSTDGTTWTRLDLPSSFDHAVFGSLLGYDGGFVIVGRDGQPDATPEHGGAPGVGKPAAWVSTDGLDWTAAQVEGKAVAGAELNAVAVGADGFFAEGRTDTSRARSGWVSADGLTWRLVGKLGTDLPDATLVAGDGTRMVMFGRTSCTTTALAAWVSSDGAAWRRLAFSGSKAIPDAVAGPICEANGVEGWESGGMSLVSAIIVPQGLLVIGSGGLPQEFWYATATPH